VNEVAMRRAAPLAFAVLAAALPAAAAGAPPALSAVASAAFPALPELAAAPASIPAEERVPGLVVQRASFDAGRSMMIRATDGQCLRGPSDWADPAADPLEVASETVRVHAGVMPFRIERLVEAEGGAAALEVQDVWVDPATQGARVHASARLPLTRLAADPGLAVYGLRAGAALHVVVPTTQAATIVDAEGGFRTAQCAHARAPMDPPARGHGAMLQILAFPRPEEAPIPWADPRATLERPRSISVSLTQLSRDPAPILSVRMAWARAGSTPRAATMEHFEVQANPEDAH
jgi:hypothetical protein